MITNNIATDAFNVLSNVSESLAESGRTVDNIYAESDSHLGDVVAYPSSRILQNATTDDRNTLVSMFLPAENGGSHSEIQNISANDIRISVDNAYDFAINHAKPIIKTAFDSISRFMDGTDPSPFSEAAPGVAFRLTLDHMHPLLNDDTFMDMIDRAVNPEHGTYTIIQNYDVNQIDPTDFFETVKTGFEAIDDQIEAIFTEYQYDDGMPSYNIQYTLYNVLNGFGFERTTEQAIGAFTMARYLSLRHDDVFKVTNPDANDSNFKDAVSHYASELIGSVNDRKSILESKTLVKRFYHMSEAFEAVVYPEVYDQWINSGGSADALFGAMINSPADYASYDSLLENAEANAETYRDHCLTERARISEVRARSAALYIRRVLKRTIEDNWDTFETTRFAAECGDCAFLDKVTQSDIANVGSARLYMIVRDVLCQVLWIKSSVYDVLRAIDRAYAIIESGDDTDINAQRALEIAKTYHITDIVTAQMNVVINQ